MLVDESKIIDYNREEVNWGGRKSWNLTTTNTLDL
jgi:hypothetical protein